MFACLREAGWKHNRQHRQPARQAAAVLEG
jgi:hypothetical protein